MLSNLGILKVCENKEDGTGYGRVLKATQAHSEFWKKPEK
jgi:hypothetical protein